MMPPEATTGTRTASTICGTSASVPIMPASNARSRTGPQTCRDGHPPRCPARRRSRCPARSSAMASSTVVAVPARQQPRALTLSRAAAGSMPNVKLKMRRAAVERRIELRVEIVALQAPAVRAAPGRAPRKTARRARPPARDRPVAGSGASGHEQVDTERDGSSSTAPRRRNRQSVAASDTSAPMDPSAPASHTAATSAGVSPPPAIGA